MPECSCGNCAPIPGNGNMPFVFSNFSTRSVPFNLTGAQVNALAPAIFPTLVKIAEIDLQQNAGLISVGMSSSLTNYTASGVCAVVAGLAQGDTVDLSGLSRQFITHVSGQNSITGLPSPATRTSSVTMGQNSLFRVNSGEKVVVYAAAPNDATSILTGVLTIFWLATS